MVEKAVLEYGGEIWGHAFYLSTFFMMQRMGLFSTYN